MTDKDESILVKLPQMGEGVHEATLIKWFKKIGEKVSKDEPLLEVATDKVDTEVVAPASGFLIATFAKAGDVISILQDIAQISSNANASVMQPAKHVSARASQASSQSGQASHKQSAPVKMGGPLPQFTQHSLVGGTYAGPIRSSPLVRKLARESGVNLAELSGSGLGGRINKEDFYRHISSSSLIGESSQTGLDLGESLFSQKVEARDGKEYLDGVEVKREKMARIRRLTAEHMLRSVRVSPHVTTTFEMDFSSVVKAKTRLEKEFHSKYHSKLSYTAFFVHACVQALKDHPMVNSSVDGDDILLKERINIACAVATEQGLMVPVLKDLNDCELFECAHKLNDIVRRAREKKLHPEDVQGGTFSITNPGIYGSLHSQPIINQPQVAILSTGAIVERPVVDKGEIRIGHLVQVGLTFDHRVIDGEGGAKFLSSLKKIVETCYVS